MHDNDLSNNKVLLFTQVSNYSRWGVACLLLLLACVCHAAVDFPQLTGRVVDQANLLSEQQASRLTALLARHEEATSNQIVIVTLPSLQGLEIANYGYQLGRYWGVGQKDNNNGVLLIVAPKQRKVRIEVGYGLEGALTDILSHQIIQAEIIPYFRDGDFAGGIESGTKAILKAIAGEYHAKPLPTHSSSRSYVPDWEGIKSLLYYIVIVGIVLWYVLNKNAITKTTFHRIVLAIIPMYVVIWLLSTSLFTASIVVWVFTLFYIAPWTAKMMSAMTLTMSTIANFAVFFCLRYFLDFQTATTMLTTLAIAILVIFPVTQYKLPKFQNKHGEKPLPNSLYWCAITGAIIATLWLFDRLLPVFLDQLTGSGFDYKILLYVLLLSPFLIIIPIGVYEILTGKSRARRGSHRSRKDHYTDYSSSEDSSYSSSNSNSSDRSFNTGGGSFGSGGSTGNW